MNPQLTILTATYNRRKLLGKCYKSLSMQTSKNFDWLIIDDGSTDGTEELVASLIKQEKEFLIRYYRKKNGGKHTALNYSHPFIMGQYLIILDDDDVLTEDAVEIILLYWAKYKSTEKIACLSFQKESFSGKTLVDWESDKDIISNTINFRINGGRKGDCAEVIRSKVFKAYPAPVFGEERFLSEDYLWINSAFDYDTVYIRKTIYRAEYLDRGLTKNIHRIKLSNPLGGMYTSNLYFNKKFSIWVRIRNAVLFDIYAFATGKFVTSIKKSKNLFLCVVMLPAGLYFYNRWLHE